MNWHNIRSLNNSQNDGFEEFVCQLARQENIIKKSKFIRKGKPDAGVECFWILEDGAEFCWQAKFFTSSLNSTQWGEIDESVKTALGKHPKLQKYYICIPIDPPDARIEGQKSMLDKWKERTIKWKDWAKEKNMQVDFIPWWSSDLITKLQLPHNIGLKYFWFNKEEFTDDWCREQTEFSIADLGKRYTPKLNIELEISETFNSLSRNLRFTSQVEELFDHLLKLGYKLISKIKELESETNKILEILIKIENHYSSTKFCEADFIDIESFLEYFNEANEITNQIENYYQNEELKLQNEKDNYRYYKKYGYEINSCREFSGDLYKAKNYFTNKIFKLTNLPYMVLKGEAGIGKSHLLADIISHRNQEGLISLFFLGQHFVSDEDPWTQICKKNNISCSVDEFLGALDAKAQITRNRIILFIDAINEGRGKYFWGSNINSFILKIKKYKWLGLVLSIRTSYFNLIFSEENIKNSEITHLTHYGFRNHEYQASKIFFENYNIELPSVPFLYQEFQNPLFLKMFCEGLNISGHTRVPDGLHGITSVIDFYLDGTNKKLAMPNRLDFPPSRNLVKKAINLIIDYKIENSVRFVSYEKADELLINLLNQYNTSGNLLEELISEGVLSKNISCNEKNQYEEFIYIAYEKFDDHLTASFIIEKYDDIKKLFNEDSQYYYLFNNERACSLNSGLIEALSIQIPEITGNELYEFIPNLKNNYDIIIAFIQSFFWRKTDTTSKKQVKYINSVVLKKATLHDLFWDTLISITSIPNHFFNAYFLHKNLIRFNLADRDAWWVQYLKYQLYENTSPIKRLIDWAWNNDDKTHISDESIKLTAITLTWFHASTNRELRDSSTKALVCLLENRIHILIQLIKLFEGVNDPSIYERLFAVAYGCTLRTKQKDKLPDLCKLIFETIFDNKEEIYPHILLRDYARGVVEYTKHLGYNLDFDISKVRPPYKSFWPNNLPSEDDLKNKYNGDDTKYYFIWSSVMGSGDFSRYIIGTNGHYSDWSGIKKNEQPINRKEIYQIFQNKLSKYQTSLFYDIDPIITEENDENEYFKDIKIQFAIGRKTEEELKTIKNTFKKSLSKELLIEYEEEIEPYLDHNNIIIDTSKYFDLRIAQRFIFSKVIELGWSPKLHFEFDKEIGSGRGRNSLPHERIGKKYQWIAYYEFMARLSDNFIKYAQWSSNNKEIEEYDGPWEPYIRDIDPTMLIKKTEEYDQQKNKDFWWSKENYLNWDLNNEEWLKLTNDLPNIQKLIHLTDDKNEEWLVLEGYPEWMEPIKKLGKDKWDIPKKHLWFQLRSYLVSESEYESIQCNLALSNFWGRWMPESHSRYEVYSREYYWSPAYKYFNKEYYAGLEDHKIIDKTSNAVIGNVKITTNNFRWEEEYDNSKESVINFLKPAIHIFENMELSFSDKEGELINKQGTVVCFDPSVYFQSNSCLLIKKSDFTNYFKKNKLRIIWTLLGQKNITGGHFSHKQIYNRLEISGAYYLNVDGNIDGDLQTKIT